jgi:hypothetical protein
MTGLALDRPEFLPPATVDRAPALVAGGMLGLGFLAIAGLIDLGQAALFLVGGLLGAALYHGSSASPAAGGAWRSRSAGAASARRC